MTIRVSVCVCVCACKRATIFEEKVKNDNNHGLWLVSLISQIEAQRNIYGWFCPQWSHVTSQFIADTLRILGWDALVTCR